MTHVSVRRHKGKKGGREFRLHAMDYLLFASYLFAAPLLIAVLLLGDQVANRMHRHRIEDVRTVMNQEIEKTLEQVRAVHDANAISPILPAEDPARLDASLKELSGTFRLPLLGVANQDGVMLSRTGSPRRGDYVFQTTPYGRRVAKGDSSVSVEAVRNYPLAIMAGVPIKEDDVLVGGFFGGHALDDAYAQAFRERYLRGDEQILFYARMSGLYGTSVNDQGLRDLLYSHLSRGSEWIQKPTLGIYPSRLRVLGVDYRVGNIPLTSLEQDAGGILVLFPVKKFRPMLAVGLGLVFLLLLIVHVKRRHVSYRWSYSLFGGFFIFISLATGGLVYQHFFRAPTVVLGPSPFTVYNSTMTLSPDSDVFDVTKQQRIAIRVDSGGEAINAIQASIHYDPERMEVDDILFENSVCDPELVFERKNASEQGIVTVACGAFEGFSGTRAILAELLFQPKRAGPLELHFVTGTQVLADDGLGTNVLRSVTNGHYQVAEYSSSSKPLLVFSATHPNQARWYNRASVHLNWTTPTGSAAVAFGFDQQPETVPDGTQVTGDSNAIIPAREDGIHFFHLKTLPGQERLAHMRVMIDTTPPKPPVIQASATEVKKGEIVRFSFRGEDAMSGIQKNFYVSIDGGLWLPSLPSLYIPFLESGLHEVKVRVFDQAENYRDASITIRVK